VSSSPKQVTIDTLTAFSEAWNRHDIDALMSFLTDDCVMAEIGVLAAGGKEL
jgi:ketosteroid isomerase-like protein